MGSGATLALVGIALPLGVGLGVWLFQRRAQWRDWAKTAWRHIHGWKGVGIALFAIGALVLIFPLPEWSIPCDTPDRLSVVNEHRRTWAGVVGGLAVFLTLYLNWRRTVASEQGQITERFTRAIDQLGTMKGDQPNIEVRIGGIYALEQIAKDEPAKFHWQIMEVLCAYVRGNDRFGEFPLDGPPPPADKRRLDVQTALTVIGRREVKNDRERQLDLRSTDLRGYELDMYLEGPFGLVMDFARARLTRAHLEGASLLMTNLRGADLSGAVLTGAGSGIALLENALRPEDDIFGWPADANGILHRIPDEGERG